MGLMDKAKNAAEDASGQGKEAAGDAKDDKSMELEGQADQVKASAKQSGEDVKDRFGK